MRRRIEGGLMRRARLVAVAAAVVLAGAALAESHLPAPAAGVTTLVVLPDTEVYAQKRPDTFAAQARWIREQASTRNIAYVLHVGDIVHDDVPAQWAVATNCLGALAGVVPFALVPGNHDYRDAGRTTSMADHFRPADFMKWPSFGGLFASNRMENSYHLCRFAGRDWIILALEFGPRDDVVAWADRVLREHPDRAGILVTHAYLFRGNVRYDRGSGQKQRASPADWGNDGEQLWQKLVRKHPGLQLVFCGHVATDGIGYLASAGDHGNTVHQVLADYESLRGGGSGYLRLVEFQPDRRTVQIRTYSPLLDRTLNDPANEFSFTLQPARAASETRP